jgi:ligand-binding sensor domain-containing protein/two-component sensor histidine kinase
MSPRLLVLLLLSAALGLAERLPLKIYTAADGLAHNSVNRIVRDSRGYLWFATSEGLSRFDGYEFHNYGRADGLPNRLVNDVLETRAGELWVATGNGLCRFAPKEKGPKRFRVYRARSGNGAAFINVLLQDRLGRIWCGTEGGLFQLQLLDPHSEPIFKKVDLGMPRQAFGDQGVSALLEDWHGDLWIGAGSGLYRQFSAGGIESYTTQNGLPENRITALLEDQHHRLWAGTNEGLCKLISRVVPGRHLVEAVFGARDGLGADSIKELLQLSDGTLCVGTKIGLSVAAADHLAGSALFTTYTSANGLPASGVEALAQDMAGNLWIGTDGSGVAKLVWKGFLTYTANDGLAGTQIDSLFEAAAGSLCVISRRGSTDLYVNEFDGGRFRATRVNLPAGTRLVNWGARSQSVVHDRQGDWWIGTGDGLFLFRRLSKISDLASQRPIARYTERDGLPTGPIVSVFEDSSGTLWVSSAGQRNGLFQWSRQDDAFHSFSTAPPWLVTSGISLFAQDGSGPIWMGPLPLGTAIAGIARFRGVAMERLDGGDGIHSGGVRALYFDSHRRLWIGTNQGGVLRVEQPQAEQPVFRRYTTAQGLSSDLILSLTEDSEGRIYAGHGSGVDRLDIATGQVKKYSSADGLAPGEVHASFRDRHGALWFGTSAGLSRLQPAPLLPSAPPPVVITSLRVGGVEQPSSELGETELSGLEYQPNQNDIEVRFVGLGFAPGDALRYQYKLEGADSDWSQPSSQRTVNYANLSPDSYRFLVRAINSEGLPSPRPATIAFQILPPLWRRWWFQLLLAGALCAAIYWLHRYRVSRLLELERVRTRIATDLHDDIGSSLSQIAILSEVANRQVDPANTTLAEPLTDIAVISRELVDSMSDIVWAIDPERDRLGDLVYRMRRFASDVFSSRDIRLRFVSPPKDQNVPMGADLRRQIFLIFKEAVHNVLRHASATEVSIEFHVEHAWLHLNIFDNGQGFDVAAQPDGHGLRSIRERTWTAGGEIEINSNPSGTRLVLRVPVGWRIVQREWSPHK